MKKEMSTRISRRFIIITNFRIPVPDEDRITDQSTRDYKTAGLRIFIYISGE